MFGGAGSLKEILDRENVSRRDFMKFCSVMTSALALPHTYFGKIAKAIEEAEPIPVVWLNYQDCAGNTESLIRASRPDIPELILETISLDYHEVLMAAAGDQAEEALHESITLNKGNYVAIVEGSIPLANDGVYCTINGRTALDLIEEIGGNAAAIVTAGTCSAFGGVPAASPNPTGAVGVQNIIKGVPIINLPGCPMNVQNLTATIVHYLTFNAWPATDHYNRPLFAYGSRIHDDCERRAHYDAGQFVEEWGDEAHQNGWCLYKMGCKGPETASNCAIIRWNDGVSWPIQAGHGCMGCVEPQFWDTMSPVYARLPDVPGFGAEANADTIGLGLVGLTAAGIAGHAVVSAVRAKQDPIDRIELTDKDVQED